jgi:hypothetical protein
MEAHPMAFFMPCNARHPDSSRIARSAVEIRKADLDAFNLKQQRLLRVRQ